jgi:hypothetical protein
MEAVVFNGEWCPAWLRGALCGDVSRHVGSARIGDCSEESGAAVLALRFVSRGLGVGCGEHACIRVDEQSERLL